MQMVDFVCRLELVGIVWPYCVWFVSNECLPRVAFWRGMHQLVQMSRVLVLVRAADNERHDSEILPGFAEGRDVHVSRARGWGGRGSVRVGAQCMPHVLLLSSICGSDHVVLHRLDLSGMWLRTCVVQRR